MNTYQALRQIQDILRKAVWIANGSPVWARASVLITRNPEQSAIPTVIFPSLWIRPLGGQTDPEFHEEPGLLEKRIEVRSIQINAGDPLGEAALIGSNPREPNESGGKGLLELEEKLFEQINFLNEPDGFRIQLVGDSAAEARWDDDLGYISWIDYEFLANLTTARFFAPAEQLVVTNPAGGTARLVWVLPSSRFDTFRIIVRRATGSTAPAIHTAGTDVPLATLLPVTVDDTGLAANTYSYAVFLLYDDQHETPRNDKDPSDSVTGTIVIP